MNDNGTTPEREVFSGESLSEYALGFFPGYEAGQKVTVNGTPGIIKGFSTATDGRSSLMKIMNTEQTNSGWVIPSGDDLDDWRLEKT